MMIENELFGSFMMMHATEDSEVVGGDGRQFGSVFSFSLTASFDLRSPISLHHLQRPPASCQAETCNSNFSEATSISICLIPKHALEPRPMKAKLLF